MFLGVFLLGAIGLFPIGNNMLVFLERSYERPETMPDHVDGIIVLGGSFVTEVMQMRGVSAFNDNAERVIDALTLADRYSQARLVFSGGSGNLVNNGRSEAQDVALFLDEIGYPQDRVAFESASRNTYENLQKTYDMIQPQSGQTWILISSAYHMKRSMGVARKAGWEGIIIPWPTDYRTDGVIRFWPDMNMIGNVYDFHLAMREYIGLIAYHFTGKIAS